ncbi:galactose/methyl galactoside ABC transporter permease MglC [Caproiciproducens sp. AGMB10547]|uniref:Galactose/methyl galactoside ABC transporter permease MglC n=2 Tax=Caproiciproducens faecalis TaxID=2820301 RepID=A0ABS7DPD1_9FIRM|nr:galactose/methyl galactoside ABC transporter permease MglC [Caproiciproducens faecalis]MBW7573053.1 galactose/methyl galactoside ABC transporter permease MglC [Caproiciproducens faecalis]
MQGEKIIPRQKFAIIYIAVGVALAVIGVILKFAVYSKKMYDMPLILIGIGVILCIYAGVQMLTSERLGDVVLSGKAAKTFLTNNAIILALLALVVVIIFIEPRFMQIKVLLDIMTQSSTRLIIALGICFTLLIAGTDLSAGRMVGLAAVISTSMMQTATYANRFYPNLPQLPVIVAIVAAVIACLLFGVLNGYLVARFDMHPFIATLAVQVIIYGACSLYFDLPPNNSQPIGGIRPDFALLGQQKFVKSFFGGFSVLIPIALLTTVIIWFVLNKTVFGKNVYAIGGNREAAIVSGVNVFATIMGIFILASGLYGIGGVLEAARTAGATNNYGNGYELDAIAACVVGGVSLNGGVGKIRGIVTGVLIFTVIQYGLQFINVSPMWQQIIKGIIIAVAVAIDLSKYRKK